MLGFSAIGQFPLGGQIVSIFTVTADAGAFSYTGFDALLAKTRPNLTAGAESFAITGQNAGLKRGYAVLAEGGVFSLTGEDAAFRLDYVIKPATGSFALTGQSAGKIRDYVFPAGAGSFTLTGKAAGLKEGYKFTAEQGTFVLTGEAAGVFKGFKVQAGHGNYALTGEDSGYSHTLVLIGDVGTFALTGDAGAGTNLKRYKPHVTARPYATAGMIASSVGGGPFKARTQPLGAFRARATSGE